MVKPLTGHHPCTCGKDPHPWVVYGCRCHAGWGTGWALDTQGLTHGIPYRLHLHLPISCALGGVPATWTHAAGNGYVLGMGIGQP